MRTKTVRLNGRFGELLLLIPYRCATQPVLPGAVLPASKKIFGRIGDSNAWGVRPAAGCMASALCHSLVRQLFWQPGKPG